MLGVGGGLYLVGVAKPDVEIALNIVSAIGGQQRVQGVNLGSANCKRDIPMYARLCATRPDEPGRPGFEKRFRCGEVNDSYAAAPGQLSSNRIVVTSF